MSRIKDIALASSGEMKIKWVERNMPVLRGIGEDFRRTKPFAGLRVALSVHLEAKTAYLCRVMEMGGAEIAVEYLDSIGVDPEKIAKIGEIIMIHEEKDTDADLSLECRIVMDADLLDEVGAVSVLWDSMATALEDDASYKRAYYRIKNFYRINKPKIRRCKTDAGRVEYNKRMQLLEEFIFQLEKELF